MEVWGREWTEEWERANTCMFSCSCRDALNCAYLHSPEELQLFKDEKELRVRKLAMRCGFCVRGECRFGPCCARSRRFAAELVAEDSGYESTSASAEEDSSNEGEGETTRGETAAEQPVSWLGVKEAVTAKDGVRIVAVLALAVPTAALAVAIVVAARAGLLPSLWTTIRRRLPGG